MAKDKKLFLSKFLRRKISRAIIFMKSNFNNTIVSVTDLNGNVLAWSSSGSCGFKGSRKSTPFAAQTSVETVVKKLIEQGVKQIELNVKGVGSGRDTAIRCLQNFPIFLTVIRDITPISHNGCRVKKKRRV
uniref:Small ribosomal subunit protein uS11c n=1 Tax=Lepocinclis tripteris TaxID=135494 RepID=A0A3G3LKZ8_9EUGL|nr:ribosomal protein S11 [Lepocinclis tripteris]AYQ93377.1 ribosomal protein S11 [Lepocinclis tripteris]